MRTLPRRPGLSLTILASGGVAYAFLCLPAIAQRGYPPIDPLWTGAGYLWIAPVALSALLDSWRFAARRRELVIYALFTAFIFEAAQVYVVPKTLDPGLIVVALAFRGPIHLVAAFAVDAVINLLLSGSRKLVEPAGDAAAAIMRIPLAAWVLGYTIITLTVGFPIAYRTYVVRAERQRGAALADEDWKAGTVEIFDPRYGDELLESGGIRVAYDVDRETGVALRPAMADHGLRDAYNQRVRQLIARHGPPAWSLKDFVPDPDAIAGWLSEQPSARSFTEITAFPHEATPSIVLMRQGTLTRWGDTWRSDDDGLNIVAEHSGMHSVLNQPLPVFIKHEGELVIIRVGKAWLGVYHQSGRRIATASR